MNGGFSKGGIGARKSERDRLLFVAAAGLAFALLVIMVVLISYKSNIEATKTETPLNSMPNLGTVKILVPERVVKVGEKLEDIPMKEVNWQRSSVPQGAIFDRLELKGQYARAVLGANQPIERTNITNQPVQVTLPVTPGNRAVTIDVDATSGLEGLALPGTRVDVVLTYMQNEQLTSRVIVQNARILSAGGDTKTASERAPFERVGIGAYQARTITLDVSPRDALSITTSRQAGRLSLIMRSAEDNSTADSVQIDINNITGGPSEQTKKKNQSGNCVRGHFKSNGQEYQINCDGTMVTVDKN